MNMKILLVSLYMVEYAVELANALVNDHQVHIILSDNRVKQTFGNKIDSRIHRSVRKTIVPYRNNAKIFNVKCILKMISAYISFSPDIIHIQEASNPLSLFLYLIRWKPIVTTVHDVEIHPGAQKRNLSRKRKWALKFLREKIYKTIIVHGKLLKLKYLADYRKTKEDVYVVPHGALFTFSEIMQSDISEEKSTVLFFGRIDKYKGLSYLIDAEPLVSKILPD